MKWEETRRNVARYLIRDMPARKYSFDRNKYLQTETLEGNFICLFMFHEEIEILLEILIIL